MALSSPAAMHSTVVVVDENIVGIASLIVFSNNISFIKNYAFSHNLFSRTCGLLLLPTETAMKIIVS